MTLETAEPIRDDPIGEAVRSCDRRTPATRGMERSIRRWTQSHDATNSIRLRSLFEWSCFDRVWPQVMSQDSKRPNYPETFEQALAWAKMSEAETGEMPKIVSNPFKGLSFDLQNSTVTRGVWDEDDNLVEMTYCAVTGRALKKKVTKPPR
jgi:hypothetical protein